MKNKLIILTLASFLHLLLWEAELGLNLLIFAVLSSLSLRWVKPEIAARKEVKIVLAAWCFTGLCVVVQHSNLSFYSYWIFFFISIGYLQSEKVRFWLFGLIESGRGLFLGWLISLKRLGVSRQTKSNGLPQLSRIRLLFVPVLVVIPFYLLYREANTTFGQLNQQLPQFLSTLWSIELNWSRLLIFCLCWLLVIALLGQRKGLIRMHHLAQKWQYTRLGRRQYDFFNLFKNGPSTLALKREFQTAILTFIALNILLFFINLIDVSTVWLDWNPRPANTLSQFVHEGTWLLILSILLAMLVVLVFLRGNLNFLNNSKRLKQWVYLWLAQNAFLTLSVGLRNSHYIHQYALAHGRIIVAFFLLLVLFGLYTMYQKVKGPKTTFYLLQTNGVAFMLTLLIATAINWDSLITRYNLAYAASDQYHLVYRLNNNLIPLLDAVQSGQPTFISTADIAHREKKFQQELQYYDWRSWNYSIYRQHQALKSYQKQ